MALFLDTDENIKAIKEAKEDKEIGTWVVWTGFQTSLAFE